MSTFAFLSNFTLGEDVKDVKKSNSGGPKKQRTPDTADIRVFSTGAVYPSVALVAKFDLEYRNKGVEAAGNGFDVFQSKDWAITAAIPEKFLIIGAVPKNLAKVDLFSKTTYKDDAPVSSVLEQGAPTFGKTLLTYLEETYGATPNEDGYIDLVIIDAHQLKTSNDVYNIPKTVSRGEKAGESTYERRESIAYYPLAVAEGHTSVAKAEEAKESEAPKANPVVTSEETSEETPNTDAPTLGELWPTETPEPVVEAPEADDMADLLD